MTDRPFVRHLRWRHPYCLLAVGLGLGLIPHPIAPAWALGSPPAFASNLVASNLSTSNLVASNLVAPEAGRSPLAQRQRRPDEWESGQRDARCAPIPPLPERRDRRELSLGDAGPDVVELKALLTLLGFYDGDMGSDRFEEPLSLAVQAFQQAVDVPVDGRVSLNTWRVLLPVADPSAAPCHLPPEQASTPTTSPTSFPTGTNEPPPTAPGEPAAIARRPPPEATSRDRPPDRTATNPIPSGVPPLPNTPPNEFSADFTGLPAPSGGWADPGEPSQAIFPNAGNPNAGNPNAAPPNPLTDPALAPSVGTPSTGGWVTDADGNATGSAADLGIPSAAVNRAVVATPTDPTPTDSTPFAGDPTLGWDQTDLTTAPSASPPPETWPAPPPPITDDWTGGLTPNPAAPVALVPAESAALPAITARWEQPTLRQGDSGAAVRQLQTLLRDRGFLQGNIDGAFGPTTEAAVRSAQQHYNLTVDGIVGPATWERLNQDS